MKVNSLRVSEMLAGSPDLEACFLAELRARLGAPVHVSTVGRALQRLGLPVKKKSGRRPSRTARTSGTSGRRAGAGRRAPTRGGSSSWTRPG